MKEGGGASCSTRGELQVLPRPMTWMGKTRKLTQGRWMKKTAFPFSPVGRGTKKKAEKKIRRTRFGEAEAVPPKGTNPMVQAARGREGGF